MVMMKDRYGKEHECRSIEISVVPQPSTKEIFYGIMAVGYDNVRRSTLFLLPDENSLKKKFEEVQIAYMQKMKEYYAGYR